MWLAMLNVAVVALTLIITMFRNALLQCFCMK